VGFDIPPHPFAGLIDGDVDANELDITAVPGLRRPHLWQKLLAKFTPRGPEFEKQGLLADIPAQVYRLAVQIVNPDGRGRRPYPDAGFLRPQGTCSGKEDARND
jgi:hypothetical protein